MTQTRSHAWTTSDTADAAARAGRSGADPAPTDRALDTRARILQEAETQFRHYGYDRTTVADLARACGMSPANIYRFFSSKGDIIATIADLSLRAIEAPAETIAQGEGSAAARIEACLVEMYRGKVAHYIAEERVHALVEMVCREHRDVVDAHRQRTAEVLAQLIAEGQARGEFHRDDDPAAAAAVIQDACLKFLFPVSIGLFSDEPLEQQLRATIAFLLRGLAARGATA